MSDDSVDLVVLGAGPGGYAAAFAAADQGLNVTLVDPEVAPGGVCTFRGCIPSKALLHAAAVRYDAQAAAAYGLDFGEPQLDLERLRTWKDGVVERLSGGLAGLAKARNVTYRRGRGRFAGDGRLHVDDGARVETVRYRHAVIATGSRPAAPAALRVEHARVWDSTAALELRFVPARLLVVGGGYIGLELATVYAALGSQVTVAEATKTLLPGADRDLVRVVQKALKPRLHALRTEAQVRGLAPDDDGVTVEFGGVEAGEARFDAVLVATGRRPLSDELGLENTAVATTADGFVRVGPDRRTDDPAISAIGDVAGGPLLAHKATYEGRVVAEALAGHATIYAPAAIPAVVFTDPELAWTGLGEQAAKDAGIDVAVARFPWGASGRALTMGAGDGVTKLVCDAQSGRVLGAGIAGRGAGELIAEATLAIEMGATAEDLAWTIHAHPTTAETLMEAAEGVFGHSLHIARSKR